MTEVRSECGVTPIRRVRAVVPCYARPDDLARVLADLSLVAHACAQRGLTLGVIVVDNASPAPAPPLRELVGVPDGLDVRWLRLDTNTGGSGGFNAGMIEAFARDAERPDALWLVDSDARVTPRTLLELVRTMDTDAGIVGAGSTIADPATGHVFEVGGRIDRRSGELGPAQTRATGTEPVVADYVAACSMLVRAGAVERAGLMPWSFINADDAAWGVLLARETGGRVVGVPTSMVRHPRFVRMNTWARVYQARNAFGPIDALGLGGLVRARRAMKEAARAAGRALVGQRDLASLHVRGLREAARGRVTGPVDPGAIALDPVRPLADLPGALAGAEDRRFRVASEAQDAERGARLLMDAGWTRRGIGRAPLAIANAKDAYLAALRWRRLVLVDAGSFRLVERRVPARVLDAGLTLLRSLPSVARIALRRVGTPAQPLPTGGASDQRRPLSIDAIIVSYNRTDALLRTIERVRALARIGRIIVVDNASDVPPTEGELARHGATLIRLDVNTGVEAFNAGVRASDADLVLILDDDAWPDGAHFDEACALADERPDVGAVAFSPVHPETEIAEWSFLPAPGAPTDLDWPVMGCANLVRRTAWVRAGGYRPEFFLYRNDADLALTLGELGWRVGANPAWIAWHDSPSASRKSLRWHELATRNWVWMMRRHADVLSGVLGVALGCLWACRLAGASPARWRATWAGLRRGLGEKPPPRVAGGTGGRRRGIGVRRLLRLGLGLGRGEDR